jgi:hypothetical protein
MFNNIKTDNTSNKVGTVITSGAIAGGIILGIVKKKGFWGTFAYAMGFGLAGLAVSMAAGQIIKKA